RHRTQDRDARAAAPTRPVPPLPQLAADGRTGPRRTRPGSARAHRVRIHTGRTARRVTLSLEAYARDRGDHAASPPRRARPRAAFPTDGRETSRAGARMPGTGPRWCAFARVTRWRHPPALTPPAGRGTGTSP